MVQMCTPSVVNTLAKSVWFGNSRDLENRCAGNRTESSNLSLSAIFLLPGHAAGSGCFG